MMGSSTQFRMAGSSHRSPVVAAAAAAAATAADETAMMLLRGSGRSTAVGPLLSHF